MSYFYSNTESSYSSASPSASSRFSSLATSPEYYHTSSYGLNKMQTSDPRSYAAAYTSSNSSSRASSVSPTLMAARNYPSMTWKDRFEASRGFDFEDDMEFCPLVCYPAAAATCVAAAPNPYASSDFYGNSVAGAGGMVGVGASSASSPMGSPDHQYSNPFVSSSASFSAPDSPTSHNGLFTPNNYAHNTITYYPNNVTNSSQQAASPPSRSAHKVRKGIQIIDPSTGLKVGSHVPTGLAKPTRA